MITPAKAIKFAVDLEDTVGLSNAHDKDIAKAREVIRDLAQQVEDLQADAARYRWLNKKFDILLRADDRPVLLKCGEPLDSWIDDILAKEKK